MRTKFHSDNGELSSGTLWSKMDIALRAIEQTYSQIVEPTGLSVIEWHILSVLMNQDGIHASKLANMVGRAATSFTPNIDKLESKGLVERLSDPHDRRAVRIVLTTQGKAMEAQIHKINATIESHMRARITDTEAQLLQSILERLQRPILS
ncbi:MAG: MarR family winged helix-turn-helix transcriptional regulator [Phototrophicaceae bacterium]